VERDKSSCQAIDGVSPGLFASVSNSTISAGKNTGSPGPLPTKLTPACRIENAFRDSEYGTKPPRRYQEKVHKTTRVRRPA
jgi:hypothetical protein